MQLSREGIQRMIEGSGSGSGSGGAGGSSGGGSVENARHADSAYDVDINSPAYLRWLRKDVADTAAEVITFAKGIISTLKSYFNGGIEVTNGTKTDVLNVTGGANVGGSLGVTGNATIGGNTSVGGNETVTGSVTAAMFIANILKTPDFAQAVGMMGLGFGVTTDANGRATLQTDDLLVLGRMIVNSLNIREVTYIGGTYLLTPAGSTVAKVMSLYQGAGYNAMNSYRWTTEYNSSYPSVVGYRLMWKADDGTTGTMNYWHVGDQAYCHTFNITEPGDYTNVSNRHYWRLVCRVGQVETEDSDGNITTWHYADLSNLTSVYLYNSEGNQLLSLAGSWTFKGRQTSPSQTVPDVGDKVVCLGSQYDDTRQGAVQITAEGVASIGIYDGINDFIQPSINNFEIHYFSKNAVRMNSAYVTWKYREEGQDKTKTQTSIIADQASISLRLTNTINGLTTAGIDLTDGKIDLIAGRVNFIDPNGDANTKVWIEPTTGTLHAVDGDFEGTVKASKYYIAKQTANIDGGTSGDTAVIDSGIQLVQVMSYADSSSVLNYLRLPKASENDGMQIEIFVTGLYYANKYDVPVELTSAGGQIMRAKASWYTYTCRLTVGQRIKVYSNGTYWMVFDDIDVSLGALSVGNINSSGALTALSASLSGQLSFGGMVGKVTYVNSDHVLTANELIIVNNSSGKITITLSDSYATGQMYYIIPGYNGGNVDIIGKINGNTSRTVNLANINIHMLIHIGSGYWFMSYGSN